MLQNREQLIQEATRRGVPRAREGIAFLRAEATATSYTEFSRDIIPTFAQTPAIARAYMRTNAQLSPQHVDLGIAVRQIRSEDAKNRRNVLYMTESALAMDRITPVDNAIPIQVAPEHRVQQLAHLAVVAMQSHLDLRLIPEGTSLPDLGSTMLMKYSDNQKRAFKVDEIGLLPPITEQPELGRIETTMAYLSDIALSREATQDFLHNI